MGSNLQSRRAARPAGKTAGLVFLLGSALLGTTQCVLPRYVYDPDATGAASNADGSGASAGFGGDGSGGATSGGSTSSGGAGAGGSPQECDGCNATQGCLNGTCVEHSCEPQEIFCSGNAVHECDDNGLGSTEIESCGEDEYCDAETAGCELGVCAPDQPTCDDNISRLCDAEGAGFVAGNATDCTNLGKTCVGGSCQGACAPEQTQCSGNGLQTCNASGQYGAAVPCEDATCLGEDGSASCQGECAPDQTRCSGNDLETCDVSGQYGAGVGCEDQDQTCVGPDGSASCQGVCAPDQTQCTDNELETCNANGQYGTGVACENTTCLGDPGDASCEGECAPGQTECSNNGTQACNPANGQFEGSVAPCTPAEPHCAGGTCGLPPSCQGADPLDECGSSSNESCCTSARVTGGTYNRINNASYPATVGTFRLDKFEVTVGRWRKFVSQWDGGWRPAEGDGKHTHLNSGSGLVNSHTDGGYELGWDTDWVANVDTSGTARQEGNTWSTWTTSPGANEYRPVNYVNWYESYAFCIWDGGFLPSEAEWNYAAAGGSEQRDYPWPPPTAPGCGVANYAGAAGPAECYPSTYTIEVGALINGSGRYSQIDLAGNVWEWQLDWSAAPATAFTTCTDCAYLPGSASSRVLRGGAFNSLATSIINTSRGSGAPAPRTNSAGVRCARGP